MDGLCLTYGSLQVLVDRVRERGVFKRSRTPLEVKVLAAMVCFAGLSHRRAAGLLGCLSCMAVQRAFMALKDAFPRSERRYRRCMAVDETRTKLAGKQLILWAARDVGSREVLAHRVSFTRSSLDAELLLREVLQYCANRPLFPVDKGPWYTDAFKSLGLKYRHEAPMGMKPSA